MFFLFITADNITTGCNFGNVSIMQTQESQKVSSQSCLTASKRRRSSNNTERNQYRKQNYDLYKFGSINFQSSDVCSYTLLKVKTVQRMHFL